MSREKSNMSIMIVLSVCAGVLLGLIIYGTFLLIKAPKGSEVAPIVVEEPDVGNALEHSVVSTSIPTQGATIIPTESPTAELSNIPDVGNGLDNSAVPAIERADEQPRNSSPSRDSTKQPEVMERNDFVLIDSDVTLTNEEELDTLENWQIRVARNEIFARIGRIFESQDMKEYFDNQEWYEGIIPAATFDAKRDEYMNSIELENMNIITKYEKDYGINQ